MNPVIELVNRLAAGWADLAWAVTWQSALFVGVLCLAMRGLARSSPGLRCAVWQIAAVKLLVMPIWSLAITLPALPRLDATDRSRVAPAPSPDTIGKGPLERTRQLTSDEATADDPREVEHRWNILAPIAWQTWLFMAWGLAVAAQIAVIAYQRRLLERVLERTSRVDDPHLLALLAELSGQIGLRRCPEIVLIDGDSSPFVYGLRRPTVVLPRELARSLDRESLRTVLLHELAHIQRGDLAWAWIPAIARLVYFFHPAAHYIAYRARLERELACDQAAMILSGQGAAGYASTLIDVVGRSTAPPAARAALAVARLDGVEP